MLQLLILNLLSIDCWLIVNLLLIYCCYSVSLCYALFSSLWQGSEHRKDSSLKVTPKTVHKKVWVYFLVILCVDLYLLYLCWFVSTFIKLFLIRVIFAWRVISCGVRLMYDSNRNTPGNTILRIIILRYHTKNKLTTFYINLNLLKTFYYVVV